MNKMINRQKHEQILKSILRDIYTNPSLQASLAFNGGTCLYIFYGLDRFSVDLDFNLRSDKFDSDKLNGIIQKYIQVTDRSNKHYTWFWLGGYEKTLQKIKVEVSKRDFPDRYINKDFYGLTVSILESSCMFAHKLCAITDRKKIQNRDLYDAHFMFNKQFDINEEIIKLRTGKTTKEYFKELVTFLEKEVTDNNILEGLGELLSEQQKKSVRATLKRDLLFDLKSRLY
ncbi:MAG: nucleotidyl transferase AbiEii/AbiGii toxin family protein [Patescibacteria group bacterium]|jgi:predicted nucleotidyltransferase component of viral defense system|nr:nucleotidyl transferase AbiEii/AbiGii toxin family protein [Patescibacteria group bacterium]